MFEQSQRRQIPIRFRPARGIEILLVALALSNPPALAQDQAVDSKREKVTYNNNAVIKINRGDYRGALEDLDKALVIDPLYSKALENRSIARAGSGDLLGATNDIYIDIATGSRGGNAQLSYKEYLSNFVDDYLEAFRRAQSIQKAMSNRQIPFPKANN